MGVIISCYIGHVFEALFEKLERWMYREDADNDPLYDMNVKNAENLLKSVNLSH